MKILIACEESQAVCKVLRKKGHEAFSCDILPSTGGHPEWHIQGDVLSHLNDGWDMMIGFPPCDHLAISGATRFVQKRADGRQQQGIDFFLALWNAPIPKIAIENPIGIMSTKLRKPDQIVQPYYFGDPMKKSTCLWLKGLEPLVHKAKSDMFSKATHVKPELVTMTSKKTGKTRTYSKWEYEASKDHKNRKSIRSKTFQGIANAMADQWA